ncbi:AsmA family protein [Halomonas sp. LS-001]
MKQLFRILLSAVGILAVVAVAAVVYVTTFLDPEDFKPRLTAVVEEQTGLNLSLEGPLTWSFYPRIGMRVEKARAWLPEQNEENNPFAAVSSAEVSVAFGPLLRGDIAVDGLTINGLRLNLERDAQGEGNWGVLLERLSEGSEKAEAVLAPASAGPHADAGSLSVVLNIASVEVKEGDIRYRDRLTGQSWHAHKLNISGSNVNPVTSFPMKAMFTLDRHNSLDAQMLEREPNARSEFNLDTRIKLALAAHQFTLENVKLTTRNWFSMEGEPQTFNLSAPLVETQLSDKRLTINQGVLEANFRNPEKWDAGLAMALNFELASDWEAQTASLKQWELTGPDGLRMRGHLNVEQLLDAPQYRGQITASPFNLRAWLERAGTEIDTAFESAMRDVALTSPVEGDLSQLALTSLSLVLDDTTFTGELSAALDGTQLAFDLQGDILDLDRYLPAKVAARSSGGGLLRKAFAEGTALLPQAWLSTLDVDGSLQLGRFQLMGLTFEEPQLRIRGENGLHQLEGFEAGFYDGRLSATGELDSREPVMSWSLAPRVEQVNVAALLEAQGNENAPLRGQLEIDGNLTTRGNAYNELVRNLNGELATSLVNGAIFDVNVSREICTLVAALQEEETIREWQADSPFERADANLVITNGVVSTDNLLIALPGIEIRGEGDFDLGTQQFYTQAGVSLVNTADAACEVNPRLASLTLPLRCEGHISDERSEWCRFDREALESNLADMLRSEVERQVGENVEEQLEKQLEGSLEQINEQLGEGATQKLRDGIRKLFE